jgi:dipeptidase E
MKRLFLTSSISTAQVGESIRAKLGHSRKLTTAFITTPIEVEDMSDDDWYQADRNALQHNGFEIFDYTITEKSEFELKKDLTKIDCLYISGGNEFYLKQQANKNNF